MNKRSVDSSNKKTASQVKTKFKKEIFANTSFEETRIAIMENDNLAELFWERRGTANIVGNIYKGTVENVLPGISSAFINIGLDKNAYIYISDVLGNHRDGIERLLKRNQQVMVQVAKDAISTKGMKVTMDISLPGRFLVLTPFQEFVGVSKNIDNHEERKRLSEIIKKIAKSNNLDKKGCIVRTEAEGASTKELEREIKYLIRTWESIEKRFESSRSPSVLHKDMGLTLQMARDILSDEVSIYMLDNKEEYNNVVDFVKKISPELKDKIKLYTNKTPIFKAFDIEKFIAELRKIKVGLPKGGSIIIQEA
ncbi:MAG: ribonuclease E/G, partial [Elusimicrobiales bacterium]|nr:ribonuclease E/G [Elusimicrobiales bacterium]